MHTTRHRRRAGAILVPLAVAAIAFAAVVGIGSAAVQAPPVNDEEPTITGTPRVGQTLTAQNGTWSNSPITFQYQWQRCNAAGASCSNIRLANQRTLRLVASDAGRTIRVRVTAVNADGAGTARSAPTDVVQPAAGGGQAPRNTARPTISGDPQAGETLTANDGTWANSPTSFTYQWQRCDIDAIVCGAVPGATGKTYGVRAADVGFRIRVEVTARNASGSASATSNPSGIVVPSTPITNNRPTIAIISIRFTGARVYARVRICDDDARNLRILVGEARPGKRSASRSFATRVPPRPCGAYTRNWLPAQRFRGSGRYTVTLRARDSGGATSRTVRRSFRR